VYLKLHSALLPGMNANRRWAGPTVKTEDDATITDDAP